MSKLIVNTIETHDSFTRPGVVSFNNNWTTSNNYLHTGTVKWTSGDWDNSTGTFTCPSTGKYLFSCTVQGHRAHENGNNQYFNIMPRLNNVDYISETVATIHTNDQPSNSTSAKHSQITCTLVVDADVNDTIRAYSSYGIRNGTQNHLMIYKLM